MVKMMETSLCVLLAVCVMTSSGTYVAWRKADQVNEKSNDLYNHVKRYGPTFRSNLEVMTYLKYFGQDMMVWRCKNTIQPVWDGKPIPLIELYCETLGTLSKVEWFHNGKPIELGERFVQRYVPHFANNRFFSAWIDFKLKIYNATQWDSGVYKFKATNAKGTYQEEQLTYVDISERKRKKSILGDYHDYGKVTKSEKKLRRRTGDRNNNKDDKDKSYRREQRRYRKKYRKNRKLSKNQILDGESKMANEPK